MESRSTIFKERISSFLKEKISELKAQYGEDSYEYKSIANQYIFNPLEDEVGPETNDRHYDASVGFDNIERLYAPHICCEINFSCAAHCRYCLRQNYDGFVLSNEQLDQVVDYVKENSLSAILITGGDSFTSPKKLRYLIDKLCDDCPSLKVIRIATRTFCQNPELVSDDIIRTLRLAQVRVRVEVATQISSYVELTWRESIEAFKKVLDLGIPVYSQNVYLKGVNDSGEALIKLYTKMREIGISPHYLFPAIPMKGTHHFRPSIDQMLDSYEVLVNSGAVEGRAKPMLAFMTSIGKIIPTWKNVIEYKKGEYIKLRSQYKLEDRLRYNPNWKMPKDAWVDESGCLCITYLDGE